ncbi:dihydrofolate reductase family protein [Leifsonia sp. H3M29-4]|uniref:dihydrofolate reductase family protein n=1 Tax=Salinibacterium metalliresistens TaxID=3031321 RepID=UPI0023DB2D51|nr:dihydrofolate reductase family protein [Salinibacterium metalliresistens]MDF1477768.1 dihydrofolate reductase family protein [Salinibacterium metalliresistens]
MAPQCSVYIATSLDGFIAEEDGGLAFLESAESATEDYGYSEFIATVDVIVMGRGTYEVGLSFPSWCYEGKRVIVLTTGPERPSVHGEEFSSETPAALVERLGREGVRRIYVDGGVTIRSFLAAGLIDDLTISVVPAILGRGIPLFGLGTPALALTLESAESYRTGLVQLRYRRA